MSSLRSLTRPLRQVHRRALLHRRPLAALTAGGAVLAALHATSPPPPGTVAVWTARRDLASGSVLQQDDLTSARFPPEDVPADSVDDVRDVVGRALAAPMSRGEVVTRLRTVSKGLLRGYPGRTAVPLRITDASVVGLLRVGDRVSFVVADPDGRAAPRVLLEDAPIVAIPATSEPGASSSTPGRLVVVAVPTASASDVAASAASSILIPVWNR